MSAENSQKDAIVAGKYLFYILLLLVFSLTFLFARIFIFIVFHLELNQALELKEEALRKIQQQTQVATTALNAIQQDKTDLEMEVCFPLCSFKAHSLLNSRLSFPSKVIWLATRVGQEG